MNVHNKYIVNWSELEDSSHIGPYLCVLFLWDVKKMNDFMHIAYKEAQKAYKKGEIPVGAVIVKDNKIIAKAHNNRQKSYNLLGHAEINAIIKAEKRIKDWRLDQCEMYVTLEPCVMCRTFIQESRLKKVYFLSFQQKNDKNSNFIQTSDCENIKKSYEKMLQDFFSKLRNNP